MIFTQVEFGLYSVFYKNELKKFDFLFQQTTDSCIECPTGRYVM